MKKLLLSLIFVLSVTFIYAQDIEETKPVQIEEEESYNKHFAGTSLFIFWNIFLKEEKPHYYQLNYGYHLTPKDVIFFEAITWNYHQPLGIPYSSDAYDDTSKVSYPGKIRSFGIGVGYQRFLWRGLYVSASATPFLQQYLDRDDKIIQSGFQLWLQLRVGYRFEFFKKRFYVEPSVAFNCWPVNTNLPDDFATVEDDWPSYFLLEPGFHFGVNF